MVREKSDSLLIIDGAQLVPHRKIDIQALGIDFLVFSGHKMLGPTGIGVVWGRKELLEKMDPVYGGGDMIEEVYYDKATWAPVPHKFEAGTPPYVEAIGLGAAIDYLTELALSEIGAIAQRRIALLVDPKLNFGLPPFLAQIGRAHV